MAESNFFEARIRVLGEGLHGEELRQSVLLRDQLLDHGFGDPRRLLAIGGTDGSDILETVFVVEK